LTHDEQKVTKTGLAIGTPEYMSPEQLGGDQLDSRTDIYSLGLVTFNMFTGQLPFPAVTSREALIMRLTEKPRTLAEITPDVQWPEEMQWVMDRALANHPGERYQHVNQFGRDLVKAVSSMPQSALSQQGTIAIKTSTGDTGSVLTPAGRTEARAFGRGETAAPKTGARRPTAAMSGDSGEEELTEPLYEPPKSRAGIFAVIFILLAAAGGGGWWYMNQQKTADAASKPAAAPVTADSAAHSDSAARIAAARTDSVARADSIAKVAAADSAAKAAAAKGPRLAPMPTPSDVGELLQPIRDDIAAGKTRMNNGEYEMALVGFGNAGDKIKELARRYPDLPQLKTVRKELTTAEAANSSACKAERDEALKRGDANPPECP
jgi:serine/threonine-protein kinase